MTNIIETLVIYQEDGLPHEAVIEIPKGLSNTEFVNFIHASIGESANIINIINLHLVNTQKTAATSDEKKSSDRPERASDTRRNFRSESRPYNRGRGGFWSDRKEERSSGGYATRSPRDGARAPRSGFGSKPSRWDSRDSKRNGFEAAKGRSGKKSFGGSRGR